MEIDITLVLTSIFDSRPRIRQTRKRPKRQVSCARTGLDMLAGRVQEDLTDLRNNERLNVLCFPGQGEGKERLNY